MSSPSHTPPRGAFAGIFLIAAATLLFQVTFIRIFSVSIWYHFAFLVVSVALFGFGASGVALSLMPAGDADIRRMAYVPALFGITAILAYLGTNIVPFAPFMILQQPTQVLYFLLYDVMLLVPFFFAGMTVALILRTYPARAGQLYAFDLVGAAIGTLLLFAALPAVGAPGAIALAGALGLASSIALSTSRRMHLTMTMLALGAVCLAVIPGAMPDVRMDSTKPVVGDVTVKGGRIVVTKWNALSRIDVVERPGATPMIYIDAAAATPVTPKRTPEEARNDISTVAYQLIDEPDVIVIGSGGGIDVQNAIALGARSVTAVEINPIIEWLVTGYYAGYMGNVFSDPRVSLVRDEGRSYVARSSDKVDVIQITLIDTWAASVSGAYSLSENYLYTKEAFASYLDHLEPGGMLSITRWYYETPRVVALGRAALEDRGVTDVSRHIAVVHDGIRALFLMKPDPFTEQEAAAIREYAARHGKEVMHDPISPAHSTIYDAYLAASDPSSIEQRQEVDISPVNDDSPFFFQMTRWSKLNLSGLRKFAGESFLDPLSVPVGQIALLTALILGVLLSVVLLSIPLLGRKVPRKRRWFWLGYFLALGVAYIVVEVVLMQRLALFLGHPTYSVTIVLFAILLFSGLGSAWSDRRRGTPQEVLRITSWALPLAIALLVFAVPPVMRALIGLPHIVRIIIAIAVIAPLAFFMGTPFPVGIRAIGASGSKHVPWAWAANGCASVIGSVLAVLGAMVVNFSAMLLFAGAIYALALGGIVRQRVTLD